PLAPPATPTLRRGVGIPALVAQLPQFVEQFWLGSRSGAFAFAQAAIAISTATDRVAAASDNCTAGGVGCLAMESLDLGFVDFQTVFCPRLACQRGQPRGREPVRVITSSVPATLPKASSRLAPNVASAIRAAIT